MSKPHINVTPLIDVLLVLLIIFMVVAPLKPSAFKAKVPADMKRDIPVGIDPDTLVVIVGNDSSLRLNNVAGLGKTDDTGPLTDKLRDVFQERVANGAISPNVTDDPERTYADRVQRTVFIKAPRNTDYGGVAGVVDAVKLAGAYPIALQIDDLE